MWGLWSGYCAIEACNSTEAGFHITELAFDHTKWMFDLRSRLRFDLLDLASGFVEHAAFAQVFVGATRK